MDDRIITGLALTTATVLMAVLVLTHGSRIALDRAYEQYVGSKPIVLRNEWGQLRHSPDFMCEASIRQWLKECGK